MKCSSRLPGFKRIMTLILSIFLTLASSSLCHAASGLAWTVPDHTKNAKTAVAVCGSLHVISYGQMKYPSLKY